jgi:hypothetical protein
VRRINVLHNIKQRINQILGAGEGSAIPQSWDPLLPTLSNDPVYELTSWSIQSAMLSNVERICSALVDNQARGKVLRGMTVIPDISFPYVTIVPGSAVTADGKLITLNGSLTNVPMGSTLGDVRYIYLYHVVATINGDNDDTGRNTPFLGGPTKKSNVVYDELCSIIGSDVNTEPYKSAVLSVSSSESNGDGKVLVAIVTTGSGTLSVEMNSGLVTNGTIECAGLTVNGPATIPDINGTTMMEDVNADAVTADSVDVTGKVQSDAGFKYGSNDGVDGTFITADGTPKTVTVQKGIITQITP